MAYMGVTLGSRVTVRYRTKATVSKAWVRIQQPFLRTSIVLKIRLYLEPLECNITSDWLNHVV